MKNFFFILILLFGVFSTVHASNLCDTKWTNNAVDFLSSCSLDSKNAILATDEGIPGIKRQVSFFAKGAISFGALFAIGALVVSGIKYNISFGNEEKIKSAKTTAIYALIGLILLAGAYPFVDIILGIIYRNG